MRAVHVFSKLRTLLRSAFQQWNERDHFSSQPDLSRVICNRQVCTGYIFR